MKIPWFTVYLMSHHSFAEGRVFDFEKFRPLENTLLSVCGLPPYINTYMVDIRSFAI